VPSAGEVAHCAVSARGAPVVRDWSVLNVAISRVMFCDRVSRVV
jgi:hypothetical protein